MKQLKDYTLEDVQKHCKIHIENRSCCLSCYLFDICQARDVRSWNLKQYNLTDKEKEIVKALIVLGMNWITKDSNSDILFTFDKPVKLGHCWSDNDEAWMVFSKDYLGKRLMSNIENAVSWDDEEPLELKKLLGEE